MSNTNQVGNPQMDLDRYLALGKGQVPASGGTVDMPAPIVKVMRPDTDRITIVGMLADDSGSIKNAGLERAVVDGIKKSTDSLRGAKGSDFFLDVTGFKYKYFSGMLKEVGSDFMSQYFADHRCTPLVATAIAQLNELMKKAAEYRMAGIAATVTQLIMTDGMPCDDTAVPEAFAARVSEVNYVVGMGFASSGEVSAAYTQFFHRMGITKIVTPNASAQEVRHAINQFSQSVASIAVQ